VPIGNIAVPPVVFLDGVDLEAAPEPNSWLTLGGGLLGLSAVGLLLRARRSPSAVGADTVLNPVIGGGAALDRDGIPG
jgi:LPXTG-motif cell wall-anchored protein